MDKPIRLSAHAKIQAQIRGASEAEIAETIRTSSWQKSELNKLECRRDFAFNKTWNGKFYKIKQVKPVFAEEHNEIVVITVYVYYF